MDLRYPRHDPFYVRFTPAFALACGFSGAWIMVVLFGVAVVICNALIVGAGVCWLYVAGDVRRERERIQATDQRIDDMIKGMQG